MADEDNLAPTMLELWCEDWWKSHGLEFKLIRRELARSVYAVGGRQFVVPLSIGKKQEFIDRFLLEWRNVN